MRWASIVAFAGWAAILIPSGSAAQTTETISIALDVDDLELRFTERLNGSDAREVRLQIDQAYGNGDGWVMPSEVRAFEAAARQEVEGGSAACLDDFDLVLIEGRGPRRFVEVAKAITGAEGRTSMTASLNAATILRFEYPEAGPGPAAVAVRFAAIVTLAGGFCGADASWYRPDQWWSSPASCCWGHAETTETTIDAGEGETVDNEAVFVPRSLGDATVDHESIEPRAARDLWDGAGLTADSSSDRDIIFANTIRLRVEGGHDDRSSWNVLWIAGAATLGGFGILGLCFFSDYARYRFFAMLAGLGAFTRLERNGILANERREQVYQFIRENPGRSFVEIQRTLGLSTAPWCTTCGCWSRRNF